MAITNSKYKRLLKPFKNVFLLILIVFSVWMLFFDSNSWFIHNELNNDIKKLEEEKKYYQNEIKKDNKEIKKLSTDKGLDVIRDMARTSLPPPRLQLMRDT